MIMRNIFYTCIIIAAIVVSKSNIYDFIIQYRVQNNWGEEVRVSGSIPELGNEHPDKLCRYRP